MWGFVEKVGRVARSVPAKVVRQALSLTYLCLRVTKREAKGAAPSEQPLFPMIDLYQMIGGRD